MQFTNIGITFLYQISFFITALLCLRRFGSKKPSTVVVCIVIIITGLLALCFHNIVSKFCNNDLRVNEPMLADDNYHTIESTIGGWSLLHFVIYAFLGFFGSKYWYIFLSMSICWEVIEEITPLKPQDESKFYLPRDKRWQYPLEWNGSLTDIVFNDIGFLFGFFAKQCFDSLSSKK